jgi:hypothetical protein
VSESREVPGVLGVTIVMKLTVHQRSLKTQRV